VVIQGRIGGEGTIMMHEGPIRDATKVSLVKIIGCRRIRLNTTRSYSTGCVKISYLLFMLKDHVPNIEDIWEIRYPNAVQCIDCNQCLAISCQTETQSLLLLSKQHL